MDASKSVDVGMNAGMEPVESMKDVEQLVWPLVSRIGEEIGFASNSLEKAILYAAIQKVLSLLWNALEGVPILMKYLNNPQLGAPNSTIRQLQKSIARSINKFANIPWLSEEQEQIVIERVVGIILSYLVEGQSIWSLAQKEEK